MTILKKIIVCILAFSIAIPVLSVPGFALSGNRPDYERVSFWGWASETSEHNFFGLSRSFSGRVTTCDKSPDGYHYADTYVKYHASDNTYDCRCIYCNSLFTVYISDIQEDYEQKVSTLPATGYSSDGSLIIAVPILYAFVEATANGQYNSCVHSFPSVSSNYTLSFNEQTHETSVTALPGSFNIYPSGDIRFGYVYYSDAPVVGYYTSISSGGIWQTVDTSGHIDSGTANFTGADMYNSTFKNSGEDITISLEIFFTAKDYYSCFVQPPLEMYFSVVPLSSVFPEIENTYDITTRPTTITGGNYGIVGDDGQLTIVNGDIINETNNTYYNPATGKSETINNWSYEYTDRSYNVTFEDGSSATVIYGNENITIIEGDVTYVIYYVIQGSGSGSDPDPDPSESPDPGPTDSPSPSFPPSGGDDDFDDGGIVGFFDDLIQYLRDHLSGAVDLIKSFFTEIPGLFNGFVEFLAAMFPFLPPEITLLLTFGIAAVVVIGIVKAIRR